MSKSKRRAANAAVAVTAVAAVEPANSEPVAVVESMEPVSTVVDGAEVDASDVVIEDAPVITPSGTVSAPRQNANSIRKTIRDGLLAGDSTETIAARLKELFPNSMAAAKSSKHIAFYKSLMRKAGELPKAAK